VEILRREVPRLLQRALLPVEPHPGHRGGGTLFLFNYLIDHVAANEGSHDRVVTFLVTSRSTAAGEVAALGLNRRMLDDPEVASDVLLFRGWSEQWDTFGGPEADIALLPFSRLEAHAHGRGWRWRTQEVTDGMLLNDLGVPIVGNEIAAYGYDLQSGSRISQLEPVLHSVSFARLPDGSLVVVGPPASFSGAPIVALTPRTDDSLRFVLVGMVGSNVAIDGQAHLLFTPAPAIRDAAARLYQLLVDDRS
jgi:hypothetical protein